MNDTAREALSAMLFADTSTPLDDVVRRCRANPVHLDDGQADALCSAAGPLVLWPEQDGFALLAADLHALVRDASLPDSGLILHLPATIRGMPLVRIAADAFRPWLSYGVGLRALIVPEGVEEISDGSLSPLCFECAALPSTLARFGLRMVRWSKLTRYPDAVEYLVDPGSATLFAEDGSLYSHDGETLIAHAILTASASRYGRASGASAKTPSCTPCIRLVVSYAPTASKRRPTASILRFSGSQTLRPTSREP